MIGTTTMAAPMTYAQAPQYTMAAPTMMMEAAPQYAMAPQYTMAAPTMMTQAAPSYVAAPQSQQLIQQFANPINVPNAPVQPMKLTDGIPTPAQILSQKNGYAAALDKQLKEASDTVAKETAIEKEMVKFNAAKQIAMFENQVDEKLTEGLALEDERATFSLLELKKALVERNLQLSAQAANLTMDYQMKSVQTEWKQKWYAFEVKFAADEKPMIDAYNAQVNAANQGTAYADSAGVVR